MLTWLPYFVPDDPLASPPDNDYLYGWSPDGSQFITTSPVTFSDESKSTSAIEELFSIGWDGQVTQLTHLDAASEYVHISEFRWSPDGQYFAFWMQTAENVEKSPTYLVQRFAILDMTTQEVMDYCLPYGITRYSTSLYPPVWAPNSLQLVVPTRLDSGQLQIMLVDLVKGFIVQIPTDLDPVGWLASP